MSKQTRRLRVYVAGPYTLGDTVLNIRNAIKAGNKLLAWGFAPFVPHTNALWHLLDPQPDTTWLSLDNEFLPICDVLLRLPGESKGADAEAALARSLSMLVYTDVAVLISQCSPSTAANTIERR